MQTKHVKKKTTDGRELVFYRGGSKNGNDFLCDFLEVGVFFYDLMLSKQSHFFGGGVAEFHAGNVSNQRRRFYEKIAVVEMMEQKRPAGDNHGLGLSDGNGTFLWIDNVIFSGLIATLSDILPKTQVCGCLSDDEVYSYRF